MEIPRKTTQKTKADLLRRIQELEARLSGREDISEPSSADADPLEIPFPLLWCDHTGYCLGANPAWFEETSSPAGSEKGDGWLAFFLAEDRDFLRKTWIEAIRSATACRLAGRALLPDGSTRRVTMNGRPVFSPKGTLLRYFGILSEMSKPLSLDAASALSSPVQDESLRILVAEDNQTNRQIIQHMLLRLGHRIEVVNNGFEALKVLEQRPFDIFFVDVQMPEMDGLETTRVIRRKVAHVVNPEMKIIAVTAFTHPETRIKCKEAGMDDFLPKPISLENIRATIARARGQKAIQEPATVSPKGSVPVPSLDLPVDDRAGIFDRNGFLSRLNGNEEAMKEIIEVFMKNAPEKIRALKDLLRTQTRENLALQAHSLAGAAANIGAERLRKLAKQLEQAAEAGNFTGAETAIAAIGEEFALFQTAVRQS